MLSAGPTRKRPNLGRRVLLLVDYQTISFASNSRSRNCGMTEIESPSNKGSLSYFDERKQRWEKAKAARKKVVALSPLSTVLQPVQSSFRSIRSISETKDKFLEQSTAAENAAQQPTVSETRKILSAGKHGVKNTETSKNNPTNPFANINFAAPAQIYSPASLPKPVGPNNQTNFNYMATLAPGQKTINATPRDTMAPIQGFTQAPCEKKIESFVSLKADCNKPRDSVTNSELYEGKAEQYCLSSQSKHSESEKLGDKNPSATIDCATPLRDASCQNTFKPLSGNDVKLFDRTDGSGAIALDYSFSKGLPSENVAENSKTFTPAGESTNAVRQSPNKSLILASGVDSQQVKTTPPLGSLSISYRDRLIAFYQQHNPAKLGSVDETLSTYAGREGELFQKLEKRYVKGKTGIPPPGGNGPTCYFQFSIGGTPTQRVVVKLFRDKVPLTAENFRCLCTGERGIGRSGKPLSYLYSKVHRVVTNFCVQLGDFTKGDGTGGESIYPPNSEHGDMWGKFKDEFFMQHSRKGLISMANNGPNRNSSQFFFTLRATHSLDEKHSVLW